MINVRSMLKFQYQLCDLKTGKLRVKYYESGKGQQYK